MPNLDQYVRRTELHVLTWNLPEAEHDDLMWIYSLDVTNSYFVCCLVLGPVRPVWHVSSCELWGIFLKVIKIDSAVYFCFEEPESLV